jgi:hypothetical protein
MRPRYDFFHWRRPDLIPHRYVLGCILVVTKIKYAGLGTWEAACEEPKERTQWNFIIPEIPAQLLVVEVQVNDVSFG